MFVFIHQPIKLSCGILVVKDLLIYLYQTESLMM